MARTHGGAVMSAEAERLPPQNLDAERCVLGSMLRDNGAIEDLLPKIITPEDFYTDAHQKICGAIWALRNPPGGKSGKVDLVLLAEHLRREQQIEDVGGYPYLAELWDAAPTAANAIYYAEIVHDKAITRGLIHAGNEILRDAYDQVMPGEELLEQAERAVFALADKGITDKTFTMKQILESAYERIDKRAVGTDVGSSLLTGFVDLDEKTAGLHNEELTILAARPSVGKTAMALNIVRNILIEERQPVFFVSLEMARVELAERLLCCQAKVDSHKLRKNLLGGDDMGRLIEAGDKLRPCRLYIDDSPAQTILRIAANARRLKHREGIRLVVVDYLQLVEPENRRDPRHEQVAQISRRLKFLAKELSLPVMALAQVNRATEDRHDHRPRLSDLRESGGIEADADTVLMMHRPELYEPGQHEGTVELIIAKQRNGPTGEITLTFLKQFLRFENFASGIPFDT
jgi:replicative DNA helicase